VTLRDIHLERRAAFKVEVERERRAAAAALRGEIAGGRQSSEVWIRLAQLHRELLDDEAALDVLRDAAEATGSADVYIELIRTLADGNATDEAIAVARRAIELFPDRYIFRLKAALTLPIVYESEAHLEACRARFIQGLEELEKRLQLDTAERREDAVDAISRHEIFLLCYQMRDDRELQVRYSNLVRRILEARWPKLWDYRPQPRGTNARRMRIGFVSPHLHRHSVSKAYAGWIFGLNRERFETFVYHVGGGEEIRDDILRGAGRIRELSGSLPEICAAIRADELDALIFLDIGMHPMMAMLAAVRLARVQCVTWGHPVTSGSRECDYFLSGELMEPAGADCHYSERLVRLPGVGVCYPRPLIPRPILDTARSRFGLGEDRKVYLCSQSTFKYSPEHDDLFVRIAQQVPAAQFVFVAPRPPVAEAFRRRLQRAFDKAGMQAEQFCVVLPFLDFFDYLAFTLAGDVYLDPPGFSGFNMALEAIACGLPVVTLPGEFFRGRLAYGALAQLGVADTIARDKADYVRIAARLGLDPEWRREVIQKMAEGESKLFSDTSPVKGLEQFLLTSG
jgi:predicted O-linked N-acetylglucosamine transferase (SPINDLY family)